MTREKALAELEASGKNTRYDRLETICASFFTARKSSGSSHKVFATGLPVHPRVNIQPGKDGKAKPYQVDQVIEALKLLGKKED